jgi:hypothetical protein
MSDNVMRDLAGNGPCCDAGHGQPPALSQGGQLTPSHTIVQKKRPRRGRLCISSDSAAAVAALQGKRLFARPVFEGKRQVVRSCVIGNKGPGQTRKNKVRARAVQGKQGRNHSEHALETLVGLVTESRNQHMIRHGGGLRSCPRCRFYTLGHRWLAPNGSVQSCARAGAKENTVWLSERPVRWGGVWGLGCAFCAGCFRPGQAGAKAVRPPSPHPVCPRATTSYEGLRGSISE